MRRVALVLSAVVALVPAAGAAQSFEGVREQNTDPFELTAGDYTVDWSVEPVSDEPCTTVVGLEGAGAFFRSVVGTDLTEPTSGSNNVFEVPTGRYFLWVAIDCPWTVSIRPLGTAAPTPEPAAPDPVDDSSDQYIALLDALIPAIEAVDELPSSFAGQQEWALREADELQAALLEVSPRPCFATLYARAWLLVADLRFTGQAMRQRKLPVAAWLFGRINQDIAALHPEDVHCPGP
jgi:hypothetical protein